MAKRMTVDDFIYRVRSHPAFQTGAWVRRTDDPRLPIARARKWPQPFAGAKFAESGAKVSALYPLCWVRRGLGHQFGEAAMLTTLPVQLSTSDLTIASRP